MADLQTNIAALLLADFKAEAAAGFPTVRRIPSTEAVKFLDYFATLNSAEAAALLDSLARGHAMQFFPPSAVPREGLDPSESNSALVLFRDATRRGQFAYGLRYQDVRHVRTALRDPESMVPGSRDGKFEGSGPGGSSHKGQHYKNSKTGNHDRNRQAGVPR
jgi:hypothetical protein